MGVLPESCTAKSGWRNHHIDYSKIAVFLFRHWYKYHKKLPGLIAFMAAIDNDAARRLPDHKEKIAVPPARIIDTDMLSALRAQDPTWELRCLRRGSLSTMARAGVPYETLKLFSLHANDTMVTRYLRGGLHAGERNQKAFEAAKHLHPPTKETSTQ